MNRFEALAGLLGGLKGAPASVLWALTLAGRPLSQRELVLLTGYSEKPVRQAVRTLLAHGTIVQEGPRVLALAMGWAEMAAEGERGDMTSRRGEYAPCPTEGAAAARRGNERGPGNGGAWPEAAGERTGEKAQGGDGPGVEAGEKPGRTGERPTRMAETAGAGQIDRGRGSNGPDHVVAGLLTRLEEADQQQQQRPTPESRKLMALLRRMGVHGRAFARLAAREDLAARPEMVLAWWWYYRAQSWARNPAGLAIACLDRGEAPPDGYLELALTWPALSAETRQEMVAMLLHNWTAEQIAGTLAEEYPGLTARAVVAFMALYLEAAEEVERDW